MNQILVTKKLYITPELKRKKKIYKFDFILSIFLVIILISLYIYAEYDKNKSEEVSQEILAQMDTQLNGQEDKIDYKKIHGVGPKYLKDYISKVKSAYHYIRFIPTITKYGIDDINIAQKLSILYGSPNDLHEDMELHPYHVFIDVLDMSFTKAEKYFFTNKEIEYIKRKLKNKRL